MLLIVFTGSAKTDLKYTVSNIRAYDKPGFKPAGFIEKVRPAEFEIDYVRVWQNDEFID